MALLPNDFSDEPENNTGEAARQPRTRLAKFLAKIAGVYGEQIDPKTEVERYLDKIAESGGGGGGGNVLTLYCQLEGVDKNQHLVAYKDENRTEAFASYDEAKNACDTAVSIRVKVWNEVASDYYPQVNFVDSYEYEQTEECDGVYVQYGGENVVLYFAEHSGDAIAQ